MSEILGSGRRRSGWRPGLVAGAAAGAAGTTALNAITYLDMVLRARPSSSTPEQTVERLSGKAGIAIPGDDDSRQHRLEGLAPLTGLATGVGTGALVGLCRGFGIPRSTTVTSIVATVAAMVAANGPMTALGVTDPRTWAAADWVSDIVPHVGYGLVTAWVLDAMDR